MGKPAAYTVQLTKKANGTLQMRLMIPGQEAIVMEPKALRDVAAGIEAMFGQFELASAVGAPTEHKAVCAGIGPAEGCYCSTATSAVPSCAEVPFVPPMSPPLNPEAYNKSAPYWIPGSPQRMHLIDLVHQQSQRLQLPKPTWTEIDALLNPFISPTHEKLGDHVRCMYQLNEILFSK